MCDRNETTLVFDSAVAIREERNVKVLLFSGDVFYESNPMYSDSDERPKFEVKKNIKQMDSSIEPPIDVSYFDDNQLHLFKVNFKTFDQGDKKK